MLSNFGINSGIQFHATCFTNGQIDINKPNRQRHAQFALQHLLSCVTFRDFFKLNDTKNNFH
jgi:hypothetical protein